MTSSTVVGIDLGTTFSCVAHYNGNRAEVIPDSSGNRLIPSFVYYDPISGEASVGKLAYGLATICPGNGLRDIKRIIGRKFNDVSLLKYKDNTQTSFTLVRGKNDLAAFQITIKENQVTKTPEEVSSEILKYLRTSASAYLKQDIKEAVISIPAYFSNAQRKSTKKAAELAGLKVLKLVTEPTAAAIHYIQNRNIDARLLVFDWGGGTLDISLIQVKNKTFKVKAVYGDTLLGGRTIDDILCKHFYVPVTRSPIRYIRRLLEKCIDLKEKLSIKNEVTQYLDYVHEGKDLILSLTRRKFEFLTEDIFERISNIIEYALDDAGLNKNDIDHVVLVGGSSRIPKVTEILTSFFDGSKLKTDLNPDEAVACGASVQAALLNDETQFLKKYTITEVTPLSLGLMSRGDLFIKFIERNSSLPITQTRQITPTSNDAKFVTLKIYEGERKSCMYNNKLGEFSIDGLPPRRTGDVCINVEFRLDEDGILTVTASEGIDSRNTNSLTILMGEFRLSERKIKVSINQARQHKYEDDVFEEFVSEKLKIEQKCHHVLYDIDKISSVSQKESIRRRCADFLEAIEVLDFTEVEKLKGMFKVLHDAILDTLKEYKMLELSNW